MPKTVAFVTDICGAMEQLQKKKINITLTISDDEKRAIKKTMLAYGFEINPYEFKRDVQWDRAFVAWLKNTIWKLHYSNEHNILADVLRSVMYKHKVKQKHPFLWKLGIRIGRDKAPTAINPEKYPTVDELED